MNTTDQKRAAHAWQSALVGVQRHGKDYVNDAKGLPALIMNSGLLQVLAFLESKQGKPPAGEAPATRQLTLSAHLRNWLHMSCGTPEPFAALLEHLFKSDARTLQRVTAEAYAWLRWVRQLAPAIQAAGGEAPGDKRRGSQP